MLELGVAEFDNMVNLVMFNTVVNGLWEMRDMGNGALGGSGALGALGIVCRHLAIYKCLGTLETRGKFRTMLSWCLESFRRFLPKLQYYVTTQ